MFGVCLDPSLSPSFVFLLEIFCETSSAELCHEQSSFSSCSQSEADIVSVWQFTALTLETQESIDPSSDITRPYVP